MSNDKHETRTKREALLQLVNRSLGIPEDVELNSEPIGQDSNWPQSIDLTHINHVEEIDIILNSGRYRINETEDGPRLVEVKNDD